MSCPVCKEFKRLEKQMNEQSSDLYVVRISLQMMRQLADNCDFFIDLETYVLFVLI